MKKVFLILALTIICYIQIVADEIELNGVVLSYELPQMPIGEKRTEPFSIIKNEINGNQQVVIKFAGISSTKYNMLITANLMIQLESVDEKTTTENYFLYYLHNISTQKGIYGNSDDDIIQCDIPGKYDGLVKIDHGNIKTYNFLIAAVYKKVGVLVTFEVSDDLYTFCRPIMEKIIKSIVLK
jgi:hypothetical protein